MVCLSRGCITASFHTTEKKHVYYIPSIGFAKEYAIVIFHLHLIQWHGIFVIFCRFSGNGQRAMCRREKPENPADVAGWREGSGKIRANPVAGKAKTPGFWIF
jgi:hypothetical protein